MIIIIIIIISDNIDDNIDNDINDKKYDNNMEEGKLVVLSKKIANIPRRLELLGYPEKMCVHILLSWRIVRVTSL